MSHLGEEVGYDVSILELGGVGHVQSSEIGLLKLEYDEDSAHQKALAFAGLEKVQWQLDKTLPVKFARPRTNPAGEITVGGEHDEHMFETTVAELVDDGQGDDEYPGNFADDPVHRRFASDGDHEGHQLEVLGQGRWVPSAAQLA